MSSSSPALRRNDAEIDPVATVGSVIQQRLMHLCMRAKLDQLSDGAVKRDAHYLGAFLAFDPDDDGPEPPYGSRRVVEMRQADLLVWVHGHSGWKADATIRDAIGAVVACFHWAADEAQLIARSPFCFPRGLHLEAQPRPPIEEEEYQTLLRAARRRRQPPRTVGSLALRVALYFLRHSGARPDEMRRLTWADVDLVHRQATLEEHKTRKKTGKARKIPLKRRLHRLLVRLHRKTGGEGNVFRNARGKPWTDDSWEKHFRRWGNIAGLDPKKSTYGLRHLFAVEMIELGFTTKAVADLLGHTSTRTVERWYAAHTRKRDPYLLGLIDQVDAKQRQARRKS